MKKIILSVALSGFLAIGQAQAQSAGQCPVHRLTVTQIKTIAPDAGISSLAGALLGGVAAVTGVKGVISVAGYAAYASDHFVFDTNLLDPDTKAGWDSSMSLIDSFTSGQDDLIVQFNGTTIVPGPAQVFHEGDWGAIEVGNDPSAGESTGIYQPMFADSRLIPDTQMSFFEFGTLRLIEYDEGGIFASESDDMGTIVFGAQDDGQISEGTLTVVRDCLKPGVREAAIAQGQDPFVECVGQAIYEVSFRVEPNQGNLDDVPERLICGSDMCSDADDLSGFDFRDGTESDLLACEAGYEPWNGLTGEASIVTFKNDFITAFGNYRVCELVPARLTAPSTCGADFLPLANVGDLNDGDIIVLKGKTSTTLTGVEYLASSAGQYLAICDDCVPGAPTSLRENAVVNVIDPNRSAAQWIVKKLASNTFALRSESGKYLARCDGCIPGVAGDSAFVHVSDPTNPVAQFTIETAFAANEFSLRSDNNRYLSACLDCVPDQLKLGSRYNASLHHVSNSDTSTGWEISVRQKLRVDPVIYDADRTFAEDITVKPSEIWVIDPGAVVTIEYGATLFIEDGGSIENNGSIVNNGSIRIGNLGKLLNQGVITNNEIIRLSGGMIDNPGVIDISGPSNHIQNYAGVINNSGVIFDPWGNYFGINPTPNLPEKGLYLGPDGISEKSCGWLDSPASSWDPGTSSCTVGSGWLRANKSLTIANGASLVINGTFTSDGTINNNGTIDNSNGLVRQCGSFNGTSPIASGNFDTACIKSTEQLLCESYNSVWNGVTATCENVSGTIAPDEVLTIGGGITWEITGPLDNDGEILIEEGGSIILLGGLLTNHMSIINAGLISLDMDGNFGFDGLVENTGSIINLGTINRVGGTGNLYGAGGYVKNLCGSVYSLVRQPRFESPNAFIDIPCPPPPPDSDNDGVIDSLDAFPYDANEITDTDGDGVGDVADAFPLNASESSDIGDNDCGLIVTQSEDSGNGCGDNSDLFPLNGLETMDSDGDCGVITVQTTTSGNGCGDISDEFPLNKLESKDTDGDCGYIATQTLDSGNGCGDNSDALPGDPGETLDSDADGVGDNADSFPNDGDNLRMIAVGSSNGWSLKKGFFSTSVMREAIPEGLPAGVDLPLGIVVLEMRNGSIGSTAEITLTYPDIIDPTMVWWKYGSTASNNEPHWYMFDAAVIAGNSVTLTIKDGGFGDDDLVENGVIVDPGGLGPREPVATNISTSGSGGGSSVSPWLLLLLTGFYGLRTRRKAGAA